MKAHKIKTILCRKIEELANLAGQVNKTMDDEDIHSLRVGVKKLRSFLRFICISSRDIDLKLSGPLKRLYHVAGAIRDARLELKSIHETKAQLPVYSGRLQASVIIHEKQYRRLYAKKIFRHEEKRIKALKLEPVDAVMLGAFFKAKLCNVHKLSAAKINTERNIHSIRKEIKDILYMHDLADKKWKRAHEQLKNIPIKQLIQLADIIGAYHDKSVQADRHNTFTSAAMQPPEKKAMHVIYKAESRLLGGERKKILGKIKKLEAGKR